MLVRFLDRRAPQEFESFVGVDLGYACFLDQDASGFDFTGACLCFANFTGANLSHANFTGANLSHANFTGANLSHACFANANLNHVSFRGANLTYADLRGASLRGVSFCDANLTHTYLARTDLANVNLTGANLTGADIDFSSWPLWCGSLGVKVDKKIVAQLLYHTLDTMKSLGDDPEIKAILDTDCVQAVANQFHRKSEIERTKP